MKQWHQRNTYFWESAPFFRLLLPFVAGILYYDKKWVGDIPFFYSCSAISIAFVVYLFIVLKQRYYSKLQPVSFLLVSIILFFSGVSVSYLNDVRSNPRWFGNNLEHYSKYLACLASEPVEKEHTWKLQADVLDRIKDTTIAPVSGAAYVYVAKSDVPMLLHRGDTVMLPGAWEPIKNPGNPFEFDYALNCRRNNIIYNQFCEPYQVKIFAKNNPASTSWVVRSHDWCMAQLGKYITDKETKGLLQAMLLGDEVNLDEDLLQSYSNTGIVQIIAISGSNVAIFFIVISALLWWLKNRKYLWVKYAVALPLVWLYVIVAGAEPSAIRAAMMFSFIAFGMMMQKENNSLNSLFATAFVLLCGNPQWLFSIGFQLSFMAVLSLTLFYKPVYKWFSPTNRIMKMLWSTTVASIAAEILVAPVVVWYFHTFPVTFIIANIVAYLFMGLVTVAGIAIILLSFIPPVANAIGLCTSWVVIHFDRINSWIEQFNPRSFQYISFTALEMVLVYGIIMGLAFLFMRKQKAGLFASLVAACILLCCFCHDEWVRLKQEHFVVYNVSKDNHIELIQGAHYSVVNDDTFSFAHPGYAVKPAHTYWHAWENKEQDPQEIFRIRGKTILILNKEIKTKVRFPVDYLIVNYNTRKIHPEQLAEIFSPSKIIIGNHYTVHAQEQWKAACDKAHIPVHVVADDRAFVVGGE